MKYNSALGPLSALLPTAKNVLIVLPNQATVDHFAAALALYLSLEQVQKSTKVVSESQVLVGHTNLFGVGQIQSQLSLPTGGNFIVTLGNVANPNDPTNPIPQVERMDWSPSGTDLKLIFVVRPGQKFEPISVIPSYEGGSFDIVFVIGAATLESLGSVYQNNQAIFASVHLVNVDNNPGNTQFGTTKIIDPQASSLTEMIAQLLPGLGLPIDQDIATNILSGVFAATNNLQSANVTADTYLVIAEALRAGGQKPGVPQLVPAPAIQPAQTPIQPLATPPNTANGAVPTVQNEERPHGEAATSVSSEYEQTIEPDWLTPKIFRGGVG